MSHKQRIAFHTFGCRLNQSETNYISNSLSSRGFRIVSPQDEFDIFVVNTCTVTENGDLETRRLLKKLEGTHPKARVALVGCQVESEREKLLSIHNVQWVVGNEKKFDLANILEASAESDTKIVDIPTISRKSFSQVFLGLDTSHKRANVKIQDGCDAFCTFCVIPFTRGRSRSRQYDDVLAEVLSVANLGCKEIVLTGVNLGTYTYTGMAFDDLLRGLLKSAPAVRFRISSIEPTTVSENVLQYMADYSNLCHYLHIPIQSACDKIISGMNRHYTKKWLREYFRMIAKRIEGIGLGTDVIVGFPGETRDDFDETYSFLEQSPLSYFHVFSYSERSRTKSAHMGDQVTESEIHRRSQMLRELSLSNRNKFMTGFLGKTVEVLAENKKHGHWYGLTEHYIRVKFKHPGEITNQLISVKCLNIEGAVIEAVPVG